MAAELGAPTAHPRLTRVRVTPILTPTADNLDGLPGEIRFQCTVTKTR